MNPDDLMMEDGIDPMPGEEMEEQDIAPAPEPQADLAPEERRRLVEGLLLEDPEMRDTYMAGMMARQQGQQQPQQPQEPQYEMDPDFVGDPALEKLGYKVAMLEQALQQSEAARVQAEAQASDARVIQAIAAKTGADQETFADLLQVPGIGQAMTQFPALAGFVEKAAKAMSGRQAEGALRDKSIAPPPSVADGADFAGKAAVSARANELRSKFGSTSGYKGYGDKDWAEMASEEIKMERKR